MNDLEWLIDKTRRKLNNCQNILNQGFPVNVSIPIPLTEEQISLLRHEFLENYISEVKTEELLYGGKAQYLEFRKVDK